MTFWETIGSLGIVAILIMIIIFIIIIKLIIAVFTIRDELTEINSTLKTVSDNLEKTNKILRQKYGIKEYYDTKPNHENTSQSAETTIYM